MLVVRIADPAAFKRASAGRAGRARRGRTAGARDGGDVMRGGRSASGGTGRQGAASTAGCSFLATVRLVVVDTAPVVLAVVPALFDSAVDGPLAFESTCLGECCLNLNILITKPRNNVVHAPHCTPSTVFQTVATSSSHPN
jgi:hypothetical protein